MHRTHKVPLYIRSLTPLNNLLSYILSSLLFLYISNNTFLPLPHYLYLVNLMLSSNNYPLSISCYPLSIPLASISYHPILLLALSCNVLTNSTFSLCIINNLLFRYCYLIRKNMNNMPCITMTYHPPQPLNLKIIVNASILVLASKIIVNHLHPLLINC